MQQRNLVPKSPALVAPEMDYVLLDGSGSMIDKWDNVLDGLNGYFGTLRQASYHSHGIVHVFDDDNLEYIQRDSAIGTWPKFDRGTISLPGGGTPLYDAINLMGRRLQELAPTKCSIVIGTDGGANGRQVTTFEQARAVLDWCRAQGWQVTFLGFDFNNSGQAAQLGATKETFVAIQKGRINEAAETLANKRIRYGRTGDDIGFSDDEKTDFGGYLAAPDK